jgi:hypothetical protein
MRIQYLVPFSKVGLAHPASETLTVVDELFSAFSVTSAELDQTAN